MYVADPATGEVRNLTQMPKVNVYLLLLSPELPSTVLIGLNDRDPRWHDVWSLDLATGERILVYENTERFGGFQPDWQGHLRLAGRSDPSNGGQHIYLSDGELQNLGLPVTYVVFPDEGHGFLRSENNLAFNAIVEAFLARYLGGRAEPVGEDFQGSSQEIRAGAEFVEALQN